MTTKEFRSCRCCGRTLTYGDGRTKLCPVCKKKNKAEQAAVQNKRKNDRMNALLAHMTEKFNRRYYKRDFVAGQEFLATLYAEIRSNNGLVPADLQRALTNKIKRESQNFASYFGAFCRKHRGTTVMAICKKSASFEEKKAIRDAEAALRLSLPEQQFEFEPQDGVSAIQWLMEGFGQDDFIIDNEDCVVKQPSKASDNVIHFEIVEFDEPKEEPSLRDALRAEVYSRRDKGTNIAPNIVYGMEKQGYAKGEVINMLNALLAEGVLKKADYGIVCSDVSFAQAA